MSNLSHDEIQSSILLLTEYRERLTNEVIDLAKKLKMPKSKIEETLNNHEELKRMEKAISRLSNEIRLKN